ncbi:MAG: triose-phosphate isomerase [Elusimicrobia bacterium]|nr:triose-phosphate isomerase [Elusimicrobiota bacterium]
MRQTIIAGNWKMNRDLNESVALASEIVKGINVLKNRIVVLCPPFTSLAAVSQILKGKSGVFSGAQNAYFEESGAFTGEISTKMIKSVGADFVILGHSERRKYFDESDDFINKKVKKVISAGLRAILCVGETLEERENHREEMVVKRQIQGGLAGISQDEMKSVVVAYEPVWAIGTGKTATPEITQKMHEFIRRRILEIFGAETAESTSVLYGGSIKPGNVKGLMECPDIDGGLVGGASLKSEDFLKIIYFDR